MTTLQASLIALLTTFSGVPGRSEYFTITVVDEQTGRGVPLVELRTVHHVRYVTDSNGVVAFYEPGLMDRTVFFHVSSHGYEFAKDSFGYRGKAIRIEQGGGIRLTVKRKNIAQRLYRVTGAGIYRDSLLVGRPTPLQQPVLAGKVFGSDSVVNTVFGGKVYWFWGDTNRPGYPLGNFQVPGATSSLPAKDGLDPAAGVDLDYFVDDKGFAKQTARMPGEGPTWLTSLVTLADQKGRERLLASYVKVRRGLEVYGRGLAEFQVEGARFEQSVEIDMDAPLFPSGHPLKHVSDGHEYVYFANPFPQVRVRAVAEQFLDPDAYEAYTCLRDGTHSETPEVDRNADGSPRYTWKKGATPIDQRSEARLIKAGQLTPEEARFQLQDVKTGEPVVAHRGSVYWNDYRQRFVMIAVQQGGTSFLGEVWYAEADAPEGPWTKAVKIATHDRYSFYNPKQHPMFDQQGGRVVFFEGTYTTTFSGNADRTPRYDYNQIMYQLDLSDPRLTPLRK